MNPAKSLGPFEPLPGFSGGLVQTVLGSLISGDTQVPPRIMHKLPVAGEGVLVAFELPPAEDPSRPVVLMTHGMGGCTESPYMRRIARKLHADGVGVFMLNQRGSGPGMGLSPTLWNGGSSDDLACGVDYLVRLHPRRPILLMGFSLGGNVLLKYLGEGRRVPAGVAAAYAVNPPVDLKRSSQILSERLWLFNRYYMRLIRHQAAALAECFPGARHAPREAKTIWDFDAAYTAPAAGYRDAEEYYARSSSGQYLSSIRVPTTILCSKDDPFIPPEVFRDLTMSLTVDFLAPEKGGHMGYISKCTVPGGDRRWMDAVLVQWVRSLL